MFFKPASTVLRQVQVPSFCPSVFPPHTDSVEVGLSISDTPVLTRVFFSSPEGHPGRPCRAHHASFHFRRKYASSCLFILAFRPPPHPLRLTAHATMKMMGRIGSAPKEFASPAILGEATSAGSRTWSFAVEIKDEDIDNRSKFVTVKVHNPSKSEEVVLKNIEVG